MYILWFLIGDIQLSLHRFYSVGIIYLSNISKTKK